MKPIIKLGVLAATAALTLSACGSSASSSTPSAGAGSSPSSSPSSSSSASGSGGGSSKAAAMITIKGFAFKGPATIPAGAKVSVTNNDPEAHTVTSDQSGLFDIKVNPGATVTFTAPTKPGSYAYHCMFHSNMHATFKVG
ncbi:MAG: cupredoxin domain-containing protein [Actinomycetota bacterium]|nr:cupredoxin domain-containing protein [Actinomycetota bacterium]